MSPYQSEDLPRPAWAGARKKRRAPEAQSVDLKIAIERLKDAREHARAADCPLTLKKIRSALKIAEGADRPASGDKVLRVA